MAELPPGRGEELPAAVHQVGQRQQEARLVGGVALHADPTHADAHDEQGEEPRQRYAAAQQRQGLTFDGLYVAVLLNDHVVANAVEGGFHLFQAHAGTVVAHCHGARG